MGLVSKWCSTGWKVMFQKEMASRSPQKFGIKVTLEEVRRLAGIEEEGKKGQNELTGEGFEAI